VTSSKKSRKEEPKILLLIALLCMTVIFVEMIVAD